MRSIFVFGLFPISSGKTVVSTALCRGLLDKGLKVAPFKPRSGHNLWYQYDSFVKCKKEDSLFCEDIIKLKEAAQCRLPHEILNPVDALMAPLDARAFLKKNYVRGMYLQQVDTFNHFLVERYTSWKAGKAVSVICVNEKKRHDGILRDLEYIHGLVGKADEVLKVEDVAGWATLFRKLGPVSISTCGRRIAEEHELMVVESFNDAVCPAPRLRYEAVLGVGPGTAVFYDPEEFVRVIKVKSMTGGDPMELRSKDVIQFIQPAEVLLIPPLEGKDLGDFDVLSKKLGEVVEAVLKRIE